MWFTDDGAISSPTGTRRPANQQPLQSQTFYPPPQQQHGHHHQQPMADEYIDANDSQQNIQQYSSHHHQEGGDGGNEMYPQQPHQYVEAHHHQQQQQQGNRNNFAPPKQQSGGRPSLREAREKKRAASNSRGGGGVRGSQPPGPSQDPLGVFDQFGRGSSAEGGRGSSGHQQYQTSLEELISSCPTLTPEFNCSEDDASTLLALLSANSRSNHQNQYGQSVDVGKLEDKILTFEAELRMAKQRLERKTDDAEKLKDDLEGARGKVTAVEQQARQTVALLSQKRDEVRRQLINEEGRTAKLQKQNKSLETEVDRLKARVHALMQSR